MLGKVPRLASYSRYLNCYQRRLSTAVKSKQKTVFTEAQKRLFNRKVYKHFLNNEQNAAVAHSFPEKYFIKRKVDMPDSFYISDKLVALKIMNEMKRDLSSDTLIIENSPGIGILTQQLIEETTNDLLLLEKENKLHHIINDFLHDHNRMISLKQFDFTSLWDISYIDGLENGTRMDKLFEGVQRREFDDDIVARLVACIGNEKFFEDMIKSVVFQNGCFFAGRMDMLLCVPPSVFFKLSSTPTAGSFLYKPSSVLFQLFFEYECISKINRKLFLPWKAKPSKNRTAFDKIMLTDFEYIYLIKVVPRRDLFKYCLPEDLSALWFFVRHHFGNKSILSSMEQWVPGCGSRLTTATKLNVEPKILFPENNVLNFDFCTPSTTLSNSHVIKDFDDSTEIAMITPTQILTIFNQFIHWPEYEDCAFNDALKKAVKQFYMNPDTNGEQELEIYESDDDDDVDDNETKTS